MSRLPSRVPRTGRTRARIPPATGLCAILVLVAVLAPMLSPHDPLASNVAEALTPPSARFWFGTDQIGRDVFSRVLAAARLDLTIAAGAVSVSAVAGSAIGAAIGLRGGIPDMVVSRAVDVLMAFPLFVLAMALVIALGNGVASVICATAAVNLPFYIRLARAEVQARRNLAFIEAARMGGAGTPAILGKFLLPVIAAPVTVQASVNLGWAILNAAGLSFLGLGVRPPAPEWGIMVAEGAHFVLSGHWWIALFPGLALMAAVLCFTLAGDELRDRLGPLERAGARG